MKFGDLKGKTFKSVIQEGSAIFFTDIEGKTYKQYHAQDCCETVYIESITGDLEDLVGSPILVAEESLKKSERGKDPSQTWTFYKLATVKGWVDIRWFGESNGYYSESATLKEIK